MAAVLDKLVNSSEGFATFVKISQTSKCASVRRPPNSPSQGGT
jgi:hypothetical protein